MITAVACAIGALGGGDWSADHAIGFGLTGWGGLAVAAAAGGGGAALLLLTSWRPNVVPAPAASSTAREPGTGH